MNGILTMINDAMYTYILLFLLVGMGIYFAVHTRDVQIRLIKDGTQIYVGQSPRRIRRSLIENYYYAESNILSIKDNKGLNHYEEQKKRSRRLLSVHPILVLKIRFGNNIYQNI